MGVYVGKEEKVEIYLHKQTQYELSCTSGTGMHRTLIQNNTSIIWNGIGKGKYKLSLHLWVGMWIRKK